MAVSADNETNAGPLACPPQLVVGKHGGLAVGSSFFEALGNLAVAQGNFNNVTSAVWMVTHPSLPLQWGRRG